MSRENWEKFYNSAARSSVIGKVTNFENIDSSSIFIAENSTYHTHSGPIWPPKVRQASELLTFFSSVGLFDWVNSFHFYTFARPATIQKSEPNGRSSSLTHCLIRHYQTLDGQCRELSVVRGEITLWVKVVYRGKLLWMVFNSGLLDIPWYWVFLCFHFTS